MEKLAPELQGRSLVQQRAPVRELLLTQGSSTPSFLLLFHLLVVMVFISKVL